MPVGAFAHDRRSRRVLTGPPAGRKMPPTTTAGNGPAKPGEAYMYRRMMLAFALLVAAPAAAEEVWQTLPKFAPMSAADESGSADVNDIKMYYAIYGAANGGDPVLMLHGGLGHSDVWGYQIPALTAAGYKVVVADSRGHGRSTRSAQPFGYALMASDAAALLDKLGIPKAAIIGWSDGGIIGLDMAMNYPDKVAKVFAFGANTNVAGLRDDIANSAVFNKYIEDIGKDYERLSPTPKEYEAFVEQISQMWATQPDYKPEQLATIKAPITIADGEHDEAIRQEHNKEMADLIPGAKLNILPGVSHFAFLQKPEQFNAAILAFLKE
jgi:pimeloyl-ACP methyl ester carboxylesterase